MSRWQAGTTSSASCADSLCQTLRWYHSAAVLSLMLELTCWMSRKAGDGVRVRERGMESEAKWRSKDTLFLLPSRSTQPAIRQAHQAGTHPRTRHPASVVMPLSSGSSSLHRSGGSSIWPQDLTPRALFAGVIVGSLLAFTNLYFGLQSSWITMGSLQAALVGYGLVKVLPPVPAWMPWSPRRRGQTPFSPQENAVLQAVAVSLGSMPLTSELLSLMCSLGHSV